MIGSRITIKFLLVGVLATAGKSFAQCQVAKLLATDMEATDFFGSSVAIDGDWAIVGAPQEDDVAEQSGAAYMYHLQNGAWVQTQRLKASDALFGAIFGEVVAMDGSTVVVSAPGDDPQGIDSAGSAYVFELSGGTWTQRAKIWASDPAFSVFYGNSVAVSGGRIVIGASDASPVSLFSGAAYVYEGAGSSWSQVARLVPSDAGQGDEFGKSVAIDGSRLVVGAPFVDLPPRYDVGAAYVFDSPAPGIWNESQKVIASTGLPSDYFGFSTAISGGTILIGSVAQDEGAPNAGMAHVFELQSSSWVQRQNLLAGDPEAQASFASAVDLQGDFAVISAANATDAGYASGAAYVFRRTGSTWIQMSKVLANDGAVGDLFSILAVGLFNTTVLVGARFDDEACPQDPTCNSGSAYVFEIATSAVQYSSCWTFAPCGNYDAHGGCLNSTGRGAVLQACGSGSVTTDDLVIEARQLPPGTSCLLFMGGGQSFSPFGDGIRVASSGGVGLFRFGVRQADAQGAVVRGPGLVAQSQTFPLAGRIQAGQYWNFQAWYRNPAGPCGSGFNLTNGLQVLFSP